MSRIQNLFRALGWALRRFVNRWAFFPPGVLPLPARPASRKFGFDRGTPIDRYFVDRFLEAHAEDIRGRVLEIGDRMYSTRFGGGRITQSDMLHAVPGSPDPAIVGDLVTGAGIPKGVYDCLIVTQTLHVLFDFRAAVHTMRTLLRPGGVALLSVPVISQISRYDADRWGEYWRMTPQAVRRLLETEFAPDRLRITAWGNVRMAAAYLYGLAAEEVPPAVLRESDPDYPLILCARAEAGPVPKKAAARIVRRGGKWTSPVGRSNVHGSSDR